MVTCLIWRVWGRYAPTLLDLYSPWKPIQQYISQPVLHSYAHAWLPPRCDIFIQHQDFVLIIGARSPPGSLDIASYPGSLIIAGEEKRAWFQSIAHALNLTC